jgi:hypothetical protein
MRTTLPVLSFLVAVLASSAPSALSTQPNEAAPPFNVGGQDGPAVALLVDPATTDSQLVTLLKTLRTMRGKGSLSTLFAPTTPTMSDGPYQVIILYVMDDANWAANARLHAFVNPSTSSISTDEKAFGSHVLAHYYFTAPFRKTPLEEGTIGLMDEGYLYTTAYRKVF